MNTLMPSCRVVSDPLAVANRPVASRSCGRHEERGARMPPKRNVEPDHAAALLTMVNVMSGGAEQLSMALSTRGLDLARLEAAARAFADVARDCRRLVRQELRRRGEGQPERAPRRKRVLA